MVKIRLKRVGKRKQPSYRVVVADSRSPRDGRIIESIGHYAPLLDPSGVDIDVERAEYWVSQGAQPSNTVSKLIEIAKSGGASTEGVRAGKATTASSVRATPAASIDEPPTDEEATADSGEAGSGEVTDTEAADPAAEESS
jgi:small subunit ribosomal protein S16